MDTARKLLLPRLTLTHVADKGDSAAALVSEAREPYYVRPVLIPKDQLRRDGKPSWVKHQFNLLPIVIDGTGVLWAEATVYILSRLESQVTPNMASYSSIADDLAAYRRFLDDHHIDWTVFPTQKLMRPTYRFNGHLKFAVGAGEISIATAHRRMGSVIGFYRWLIGEGALKPINEPWKETDRYVHFGDAQGFRRLKKVASTDISIRIPHQQDPYDGRIEDGGKLKPLTTTEQEWVVEALSALGNTEMTLIHLLSLLTGARIQSVLTMRLLHALLPPDRISKNEVRLPIGAGTAVDTKFNKRMVLHIPTWFYTRLQTYAQSDRARKRRENAPGGDHQDQYLFLSHRGSPLYDARAKLQIFDATNQLHHSKSGQAVRQFILERVIPFIKAAHMVPTFHFQFHDLRATAGMNWTDAQLSLVREGKITLNQAREFVKTRMGHESSVVTDRYLQFRHTIEMVRRVEESHERHLRQLVLTAIGGLE